MLRLNLAHKIRENPKNGTKPLDSSANMPYDIWVKNLICMQNTMTDEEFLDMLEENQWERSQYDPRTDPTLPRRFRRIDRWDIGRGFYEQAAYHLDHADERPWG